MNECVNFEIYLCIDERNNAAILRISLWNDRNSQSSVDATNNAIERKPNNNEKVKSINLDCLQGIEILHRT